MLRMNARDNNKNNISCWLLTDADVDEAFGDLDVDGEADPKQDDAASTGGQSVCPSTDFIIVMENPGKYDARQCKTVWISVSPWIPDAEEQQLLLLV